MYVYTWRYACFPCIWLGQWSGKSPSDSFRQGFLSKWQCLSFTLIAFKKHVFFRPFADPQTCTMALSSWLCLESWTDLMGVWHPQRLSGRLETHVSSSPCGPASLSAFETASLKMPQILLSQLRKEFWETLQCALSRVLGGRDTLLWSRQNQMASKRLQVYGEKIRDIFCSC